MHGTYDRNVFSFALAVTLIWTAMARCVFLPQTTILSPRQILHTTWASNLSKVAFAQVNFTEFAKVFFDYDLSTKKDLDEYLVSLIHDRSKHAWI